VLIDDSDIWHSERIFPMTTNQVMHRVGYVAARLGVSERTIARWVDQGLFPSPIRVGRGTFWTESDIAEWLAAKAAARSAA
jgi:predicted DNA-binding transcriptional regulator AlpA